MALAEGMSTPFLLPGDPEAKIKFQLHVIHWTRWRVNEMVLFLMHYMAHGCADGVRVNYLFS